MNRTSLSDQDKLTLLRLARETLELVLSGKTPPGALADLTPGLAEIRGAFVTLNRKGRLRGCIGTFVSRQSLGETVREMAVQAALYDPRFPEVSQGELSSIDIEISALTPLRAVKTPEEVEVGRHGLHLSMGARAGVLLPQVATEYGWDREEFLEQTCHKAGLPPQAWKEGARIQVFEAEVFSENEVGGKTS